MPLICFPVGAAGKHAALLLQAFYHLACGVLADLVLREVDRTDVVKVLPPGYQPLDIRCSGIGTKNRHAGSPCVFTRIIPVINI